MTKSPFLLAVPVGITLLLVAMFARLLWLDVQPRILVNDTDHDIIYRSLIVRSEGPPHIVVKPSQVLAAGSEADVSAASCVFIEDGQGNVVDSIGMTEVASLFRFIDPTRFVVSGNHSSCHLEKSDAVCEVGHPKEGSTPAETCP